jgi:hypothetical protein
MASGNRESTTGAWAAAAVVLAVGALAFGVVAQVRATDLEDRVTQLEALGRQPIAAVAPGRSTTTTLRTVDAGNIAAETAVRHAFGAVYDASTPASERLAAVDDPRGVEQAFRQAATGQFSGQATQASVNVSAVNFTSETGARVSYEILIGGQPRFTDRIGTAALVGGAWRVSRTTVCTDLQLVGATCG